MVFLFYIDHCNSGDYYKIAIRGDSKTSVTEYLESISREVVFKETTPSPEEEPKEMRHLPCGDIIQYKYHGRILPKGLQPDRRYHRG